MTHTVDDSKLRSIRDDRKAVLTINVDGPYLSLDKFRDALDCFSEILVEVDKEISENGQATVKWAITDIRNGSLHLAIEANILNEKVPSERPHQIISIFSKGMQAIQEQAIRPEGFSNKAVKAAKRIASILDPDDLAEIGFRSNGSEIHIQPKLASNTTEITDTFYKYRGSIEGELTSISVAGRRQFGIRTPLQKNTVKCFFGNVEEEQLEIAMEFLGKRVYVYGVIRQRFHGEKINIQVEKIRRLPDRNEAVSTESLLQMIRQSGNDAGER